ncbi:hypothetical protein [Chroococcidiopsis sp.]|uniref:hypothetical protein n=1 Tax=Chroococcidiopsis sp. TaxID=3088168 RepID=UPI003F3BDE49
MGVELSKNLTIEHLASNPELCKEILVSHKSNPPFIALDGNWYIGSTFASKVVEVHPTSFNSLSRALMDKLGECGRITVPRSRFIEASTWEGAEPYSFQKMPPVLQAMHLYPAQFLLSVVIGFKKNPMGRDVLKALGMEFKKGIGELFLLECLTYSEEAVNKTPAPPANPLARPVQIVAAAAKEHYLDVNGVYCDASVSYEAEMTRIAAWSVRSGKAVIKEIPFMMSVEEAECLALVMGYRYFKSKYLYTDNLYAVEDWKAGKFAETDHPSRSLAKIRRDVVIQHVPREVNTIADQLTRTHHAPSEVFLLQRSEVKGWIVPTFSKPVATHSDDVSLCVERKQAELEKYLSILKDMQDKVEGYKGKVRAIQDELAQLAAVQQLIDKTLSSNTLVQLKKAA